MSAVERLKEKVALAVRVKSYLKRTPTGHIEPVVAHERTGAPAAPPGITPLGPPPPEALAPPEPAPASQEAIQAKTHSVDDVVSGKYAVGVEGSGGNDLKQAKAKGLYTTKVEGIPIFAKDEKAARPVVNYLKAGGKYGSTEFSRLLGYSRKEIAEYERYLRSKGHEGLIEPEPPKIELARVQWRPYLRKGESGIEQVAGHVRLLDLEEAVKPSERPPEGQKAPLWTDPGPEPPFEAGNQDERRAWRDAMGVGVATGAIEPEGAIKRGWTQHAKPEEIKPLPPVLYHATSALGAVQREGLKTIGDQGDIRGLGGGGGEISLTDDREYAERIAEVLRDVRDVLRGETSPESIERRAEHAGNNVLPRMHEFFEQTMGKWDQRVTRMMRQGSRGGLVFTPEEYGNTASETEGKSGWRPRPGAKPLVGGDGKERYLGYDLERPQTREERLDTLYHVYDAFLWAQGEAGGPTNPVLFSPNLEHLASLEPGEIGVVEVRPRPGSKGWQDKNMAGAEGEWRTWSGRTLDVSLPKAEATFEDEPGERIKGLSGAWDEWLESKPWERKSSELDDPRLQVVGERQGVRSAGGQMLGNIAGTWEGDHIKIGARAWDEGAPDTNRFLLAHEASHAAAGDILANVPMKEREAILAPFKASNGGFSEMALHSGEDSFARTREEMLADVGATILTFGPDVLDQRYENEKKFDISPEPPDPRLVRLFATVAESLRRVGLLSEETKFSNVSLARTWVGPYLRPGDHGIEWVDPHWRTYERGAPLPPAAAPRRPAPVRPVLSRDRRDYPKNWDPTPIDVGRWQEGELQTDFLADIAMRNEASLQTKREYEYQDRWQEFLADIRANGIREPILVMVNDSRDTRRPPIQIEGHRRLLAARELGLDRVPVEVRYYGTQGAPGGPDLFEDAGFVRTPATPAKPPKKLVVPIPQARSAKDAMAAAERMLNQAAEFEGSQRRFKATGIKKQYKSVAAGIAAGLGRYDVEVEEVRPAGPAADLTPRELQDIEDEITRFKREGMGPAPTSPPEPVLEPEPAPKDIIDQLNSDVFYAAHYYDSFEIFQDRYNSRSLMVLPKEGWTKGDQDKFVYMENYTEEGLRELWDRAHAPDQVPGWAPTPVRGFAYIPVKQREGEPDDVFRIRQMERRRVEVLTEPNERGDVIVWDGTEAQVVKHKNLLRSPFRMMLPHDTTTGQVHAVVADPERGRIYAVVSGNRVLDGEVVEEAKLRLKQMIELNRTVEADVGLRNKWNGTLQIGIEESELRKGAGGVKEWGCAIAVDVGVLDAARRARFMQDRGIPEAAGRTDQETTQLLIHELVHGMSAAVPGSNRFMYMGNAALEEGVAEGYTTALLQVQRNGPDSPAFGPGGDLTTLPGTDWHAYSEWVEGLDHVFGDTTVDEEHPLGVMTGRLTAGQRLEFYRDMLKTRLQGRERKVRSISKQAGFNTWFEGRGLGSEMKFVHTRRPESPFYREPEPVREPTTTRSPMHDMIYTAETPEDARAIYPEIKDYLATAPADAGPVSRDAEALVHLGTADGRTLSGEFDRPGADEYAATWEELPDTIYHVAPRRVHDAIVAEGLQPQGHAWNFALSKMDQEAGGHWDPETKTYVGPGSDDFGWRPEAAYVFADRATAAQTATEFMRRHGESFEVFAVDTNAIRNLPPQQRPDLIKDPEQIQQARLEEREQRDYEGEDVEPRTADEIFDELAEYDYGEGERDYRQWAIAQVPPQFVRSLAAYEYKDQEDWDELDWGMYERDHPEEFEEEEELEPPIVRGKAIEPEFTPTPITDLKSGDKVVARRAPNTTGRTFTVVRVSEKAGMVETLDDRGRPRNFPRSNVMRAGGHTLTLQQASLGSRHFIATCSCGWMSNPQTQGRARGAWKRHAAAEPLRSRVQGKAIAPSLFDPRSEDPGERAHTVTGPNDPVPEGYVRLYRGVSAGWTGAGGVTDESGVWYSNTYETAVSYANLGSSGGRWGGPMDDPTKSAVLAVDVPVADAVAYAADAGHPEVDAVKAATPDPKTGGIEVRVPFAVSAKAGVIEGTWVKEQEEEAEFLDVPTHVADLNDASALLWAAEMRDQGVRIEDLANDIRSMLTDEYLVEGRVWYPDALNVAADISKDTGVALDRVVTAIAVMSPRCQWEDPESGEGEKKYVRSLAKFVADGGTDGLTADEAAVAWKKHYKETNTVLGLVKGKRTGDPVGASVFNNNTAKAIRVMRGEVTPGELLIDNKTRSFYDNIMFPQDPSAVTIDTHMMKVFERVYGVTYKDADMFSRHDRKVPKGGGQVRGIGYIALAEAIRQVAAESGETPNAIQAAYWLRMQSEPHILENGQPWPGRDPVMAFARALEYLDTDFELRPTYSPEEVAQNRLTDAEVEAVFEREQEEADRYERPVGLARVDVIRHLRLVRGKVQDVAAHQRKLDIESLLAEPAPAPVPGGPKYTIGTLHPDDQEVIRAMLPRLSARYPAAARQIKKVTAAFFKGRWASFHDEGTMKFNNIGGKYTKQYGAEEGAKYRDPELASTVAHEFGHAVMQDLAGGEPTGPLRQEIKVIDAERRKLKKQLGRFSYSADQRARDLVAERNKKVSVVNEEIHEQQRNTNELIKEVMGRVRAVFEENLEGVAEEDKRRVVATRLHDQIVSEFAENPSYVLSDQEELFAQAFAHYEMGQRGIISDIVGGWVQEKYGKVGS